MKIFDSIDELLNSFDAGFQTSNPVRWEMVMKSNADPTVIMVPVNPVEILFRGQHTRYQPCVSSICRGIQTRQLKLSELEARKQNQIFLSLVRSEWFCRTIEQHPIFKWATAQRVFIDKMALAQHYGIPTGFLDLTQDIYVAAFFACCHFKNNKWHPMEEGEGVMYLIPANELKKHPEFRRPIVAISHQPFPRPTEQWGWTFETFLGDDFESFPYVKTLRFKHNIASSNKLLNRYNGGNDLFLPDPLADIAHDINESVILPRQIVISFLKNLSDDHQGIVVDDIEKKLEEISLIENVKFSEEPIDYFTQERIRLAGDIWSQNEKSFFKSVTFRLIRPGNTKTDQ